MSPQFKTPISAAVAAAWGASRGTHPVIAMAVHALARAGRSPDAIWEAPTRDEWEHVAMAVENYISAGRP